MHFWKSGSRNLTINRCLGRSALWLFGLSISLLLCGPPNPVFAAKEKTWQSETSPIVAPPARAGGSGGRYSPVVPAPVPDVIKIQRDLENILQIHRNLEVQKFKQIREITQITEQARIHQQLLKDLALTRQVGPARTTEEAIRLQKIQLIQKQAQKNQAVMKKIQEKAAKEGKLKSGKKGLKEKKEVVERQADE